MKFNLQIDLGNEPSAKNLAGQLHKEAVTFWTATEPLKPQVWGIDDPRTMATAGKWEISEGKTLADFAGSGKAFKRPHHALAFGFIETTGFLKEFSYPDGDIGPSLARLTAEDLTATDWEEVPE